MMFNKILSFNNIGSQFLEDSLNDRYCNDILEMVKMHHLADDISDKTLLCLSDNMNTLIVRLSDRLEPLVRVISNAGTLFEEAVFHDYRNAVSRVLDSFKDRFCEDGKVAENSLLITMDDFDRFNSLILKAVDASFPHQLFLPYSNISDSLDEIFKDKFNTHYSLFAPFMNKLNASIKDVNSRFSKFLEDGIVDFIMARSSYSEKELTTIGGAFDCLEDQFNSYIDLQVKEYKRGASSVFENESLTQFIHRKGECWTNLKGISYGSFSVQVSIKLLSEKLSDAEATLNIK